MSLGVLVAALVLLVSPVLTPAAMAEPPTIDAPSAIAVEVSTGDVVFARRARQARPMASTTKLMTALVALERDDLDARMTVRPYAAGAAESLAGLHAGNRMTVEDLLAAMLLPSGNDAAHTIAVDVAGSVSRFVDLMNRRARELGLTARFRNAIGLDQPGHEASPTDLVKMTLLLRRYPAFRRIVNERSATLGSATPALTVTNRNDLVQSVPWVDGVKTGHTRKAGYALVASGTRDGVSVVTVVLGDPSEAARDADSLALLKYAQGRYRRVDAVRSGAAVGHVALRYRSARVGLVAAHRVRRVVRRGEHTTVRVVGRPADVEGPLAAGSRLGTVEVVQRGRVVARVPALTAVPVAASSVWQRAGYELGRPGVLVLVALALLCAAVLVLLILRRLSGRDRPGAPLFATRSGPPGDPR